jgi:hypothetical protein
MQGLDAKKFYRSAGMHFARAAFAINSVLRQRCCDVLLSVAISAGVSLSSELYRDLHFGGGFVSFICVCLSVIGVDSAVGGLP